MTATKESKQQLLAELTTRKQMFNSKDQQISWLEDILQENQENIISLSDPVEQQKEFKMQAGEQNELGWIYM